MRTDRQDATCCGVVILSSTHFEVQLTSTTYGVITNDVSDSYQFIYVIAHIIWNHPLRSNFTVHNLSGMTFYLL